MKNKKPYLINFFYKNFYLKKIKNNKKNFLKINNILNSKLPIQLKYRFRIINIKNQTLFLETSNFLWVIRLINYKKKIISIIKKNTLISIFFLKIKINPYVELDSLKNNKKNIYNLIYKNKVVKNNYKNLTKKSIKSILYISNISEKNISIIFKRIAKLISNNILDIKKNSKLF